MRSAIDSMPDQAKAQGNLRTRNSTPVKIIGALALFSLLLSLGAWQLQRAEEKRERAAIFQQRFEAAPIELAARRSEALESLIWRQVRLAGRFSGPSFILENRTRNGRVGFEVLSIFSAETGFKVLVNRGWVIANADRRKLPRIDLPNEVVALGGYIGPPPVTGIKLNDATHQIETIDDQLVRIQIVDLPAIARAYNIDLEPYVLYLDESSPGGYERQWLRPGDGSERHTAYAVQWFSMAFVLVVIVSVTTYRNKKKR